METEVEFYKGEQLSYYGRVPLAAVLRAVFTPLLKERADDARFLLTMREISDPTPIDGEPRLVNLRSVLGYADVIALVDGTIVYRHPHRVSELLGPVLQRTVAGLDPDEAEWGFCVSSPELDDYRLERPAPLVEGAVDIDVTQARRLSFVIQKVPDPPLEVKAAADVGIDPADLGPINVLVRSDVADLLCDRLALSLEVEEGGFLSGHVYATDSSEEQYIVEVAGVCPAEHSGASLLHFTFTGDSFRAMNRMLVADRPGEQLLGWYHTHLFAATESMGLSSIDVELHFGTFRRPWQLAGLVNIADGKRVLRFYARRGDEMQECPQWVADERGRYGTQGSGVGSG